MKKSLTLVSIVIVAIVSSHFSCTKEAQAPIENSTFASAISVADAKKWYENQSLSNKRSSADYIGVPDWEHSFVVKNDQSSAVLKVPLTDIKTTLGYRDLILQQRVDGSVYAAVLHVILSPDYIGRIIQNKGSVSENFRTIANKSDFTGYLLQYDLKNNFIEGRCFENGKQKRKIEPESPSYPKTEQNCDELEGPDKNLCWIINLPQVTIRPEPVSSPWLLPTTDPRVVLGPGPGSGPGGYDDGASKALNEKLAATIDAFKSAKDKPYSGVDPNFSPGAKKGVASLKLPISLSGYSVSFGWDKTTKPTTITDLKADLTGLTLGIFGFNQMSQAVTDASNNNSIKFTITGNVTYTLFFEGIGTIYQQPVTLIGTYSVETGNYTLTQKIN